MKIKDIGKYIELYETEKYLFKVIGPRVKKRGYFLFEEFYKICMWKSARQKRRYIKNKNTVEGISKSAFKETDEISKMVIFCTLEGVSIATASALLTIVFPDKYAVIDIRCLQMLMEFKCEIGKYPSLSTWIDYLNIMRLLAKENNVTTREMDMALFAMHRENLEQDDFRNLYKG